MKQQDDHFPSKASPTAEDLNTCVEEELSNNVFQNTVVKMIHDLKEERQS
jgi:hypothetical protein